MGNCNLKSEDEGNAMSCKYRFLSLCYLIFIYFLLALHKGLFEYKYAIGRGGFGKVWRVSSTRLKGETTT